MPNDTPSPLTKTNVLAVLKKQAEKWANARRALRRQNENPDGSEAPEIEALIETKHHYRLMEDQAKLFFKIVARIQ